jgi:hypothetical protein
VNVAKGIAAVSLSWGWRQSQAQPLGPRESRAPTSAQPRRIVPSRPPQIDQQAVAIDAQHAALDLVGVGGRQAVAEADVAHQGHRAFARSR